MATITAAPARITVIPNACEVQKVETQNSFDYYAIFDVKNQKWSADMWVRVPEGATSQQVEDAFFRGDLVSGL